MVRQFLFDAFDPLLLDGLFASGDKTLGGIAAKAEKEARYHLRHSAEWVRMLGGGTDESHARAQAALDELWPYADELFHADAVEAQVVRDGIGVDPSHLRAAWQENVQAVFADAGLDVPDAAPAATNGRIGRHSEHLGRMLADMQSLARAHPGATW